MKVLLVLGALLLSASPAIADDFVYLKCDTKMLRVIRELSLNKITMIENIPELVHFKIDTVNGRIRNSYMYVWEEADIVDGTTSYKVNLSEIVVNIVSWRVCQLGSIFISEFCCFLPILTGTIEVSWFFTC